jgi:hypothetical protein
LFFCVSKSCKGEIKRNAKKQERPPFLATCFVKIL